MMAEDSPDKVVVSITLMGSGGAADAVDTADIIDVACGGLNCGVC